MPQRILLICLSLFLVKCASDDFPTDKIYQLDLNNKVCDEYLLNKKTIKIKFNREIPLTDCPRVLGFDEKSAAQVFSWARRMKEKLNE